MIRNQYNPLIMQINVIVIIGAILSHMHFAQEQTDLGNLPADRSADQAHILYSTVHSTCLLNSHHD